MAGSPGTTTQPQPSSGGPDGLLATKLFVPRPPSLVPRPRLLNLLNQGLARELTVVCAPAGFGKTALLADLCHRRQQPVAWLSLDAGDSDPVRFWRHVAAAVDRVWAGVADRIEPLLGALDRGAFEGLVSAVVNELAAEPGETLLILDDYHVVDAEPVHASLVFLLEHAPPGLRMVLASRVDPPWPLARWRARGQLAELRAADLQFTVEEAAALLDEIAGSDLSEDAVQALAARTEGWAAGLQLAGLRLRDHSDAEAFVESFSGSHRFVLDYLTEEVLELQPEPVREFLLDTSVLERMSGPLCDVTRSHTGSQQMLEALEQANLFLMPLDDVRGWWRYHNLFAQLLQARLAHDRPERLRELHRNAARWHEQHRMAGDAVHHALATEDTGFAAYMIERFLDELLLRSEAATMDRWVTSLPSELVSVRPRLLLAQARASLIVGDLEKAQGLTAAVQRAYAATDNEDYEPSVGTAASLLGNLRAAIALNRAFLAQLLGNAEDTATFAAEALAEASEQEAMLVSFARWHLAMADRLRGNLRDAERGLGLAGASWRASGHFTLAAWIYEQLGQVQQALGRLDDALASYEQVVELATAPPRLPSEYLGISQVGMAEVAYRRNDLDTAWQHITEGVALYRQLAAVRNAYALPLAAALTMQAKIWHAKGDLKAARDAIDEAEGLAPTPAVATLFNPAPAERVRLLLAEGDVDGAEQWVAERGLDSRNQPDYPHEFAYLVLARVLIARDQAESAVRLLDELHAMAIEQHRTGSAIEIQALRALASAAAGDDESAMAALAEALTLGHPQRYIRVFIDEGPPMAALLGRFIAIPRTDRPAAIPGDYLGQLVQTFEQSNAAAEPGRASVPGLVTQLSERELEVLRLLSVGNSNREIAAELFVSVYTVKKHVTHIFDKLGTANRTEATTRARELGLLG